MPGKGSAAKLAKLGGGDGGDGFVPLEGNPASSSGRGDVAAEPSRVVYIGHLPHGFYEKQLLGYFSQFGRLTRVRLSRNKKSGRARGYAFMEFQYPEVARVASEAMDGYFLFKQRLVCRLVPSDKVHPQLFAGARHKFRNVPWRKIERQRHDKQRTPEEHARRVARAMKRDRERQRRIKAAGLEYDYEGLEAQLPPQPKKTTFE